MSNYPLTLNSHNDLQRALDALADVAIDSNNSWNTRETALNALEKAGALGSLAKVATSVEAADWVRSTATRQLAKLVSIGGEITLTQTDIEGILRVRAHTEQLKVK